MIVQFLAEGFEEIEALAVTDILRRASLPVKTVGIGGKTVRGSHGIPVIADWTEDELSAAPPEKLTAVILPGGMPGTTHLMESALVRQTLARGEKEGALLCAICAAPSVLGRLGYLKGKRATCFPGFEEALEGARVSDEAVVADGRVITARGAGVALEFGFAIVSALASPARADELKASMQCR